MEPRALTRLQAAARGASTRAAVIAATRSDFLALCERLDAGAPAGLATRPRWPSATLCAPRFAAAAAPAPRPPPHAPTPPKPRRSPDRRSRSPPPPPPSPPSPTADVRRELDWARAALRSRLAYLERDPFNLGS